MHYNDIPQFTRTSSYKIDVHLDYLLELLRDYADSEQAPLDLNPDFQRPHVWSEEQQRKFVEFILRGGQSSRDIYFNCPGWMGDWRGPFQIVDGKQRLEALRRFLENELDVFGGHYAVTFEGRSLASMRFHINNLAARAEVLQWYLDLNTGGVVHSDEEIAKVQELLEVEKANDNGTVG